MIERASTLFLLTADSMSADVLSRLCEQVEWRCLHGADGAQLADAVAQGAALALIDERIAVEARQQAIAAVRALPGFAAGTPILQCGSEHSSPMPGIRATITLPWTAEGLHAAIHTWAGPVQAHALRHEGDPRFALIRLLGYESAAAMLGRLTEELKAALARPDIDAEEAHRLAGLSGMMGLKALGVRWSAVETGEVGALEKARQQTSAMVRMLDGSWQERWMPDEDSNLD